ncbi:MAG: hypothetical protein QOE11_1087, partial [Solirubrobacteraceae bacterium]|nr:hypothetical protein [Solirubrobacteraceae bacterium]
MDHVAISAGSVLTIVALLGAYMAVVAAAGARLGLKLRSDESLALGIAMVCAVCVAGFYASRILTAVSRHFGGAVVTVPLTLVIVVLATVPLACALILLPGRRQSTAGLLPGRGALRAGAIWSLPALLIVLVAAAATL